MEPKKNKVLGLDGKPLEAKEEVVSTIDYSHIKISDLYQPRDYEVIIEEPKGFSTEFKFANREQRPLPSDMDMVFTVVAKGKEVTNFEIGDKVLLKSLSLLPINLVSEIQFQITEDGIAGKVLNPEYEAIRKFYRNKKVFIPTKFSQQMPMGYDKKPVLPDHVYDDVKKLVKKEKELSIKSKPEDLPN